jgi:hypothetical protein
MGENAPQQPAPQTPPPNDAPVVPPGRVERGNNGGGDTRQR